jgi:predicted Zn-dependent protease
MSTPRSFVDDSVPDYPTKQYCLDIANRVIGFATQKSGTSGVSVRVTGNTRGNIRWVRNKVSTSGEQVDRDVWITAMTGSHSSLTRTNEATDEALKATVMNGEKLAQAMAKNEKTPADNNGPLGPQQYNERKAFFDNVVALNMEARSTQAKELVQLAVGNNFMSYGFLSTRMMGTGVNNSAQLDAYFNETSANFSVTVRDGRSFASGWAGKSHEDLAQVDMKAIMNRAIDKCKRSMNPMTMEPGRYTAILEPQAVYDMLSWTFLPYWFGVEQAQKGIGPFAAPGGKTKIGQQMLDRRISIYSDPADPDMPFRPFFNSGSPNKKTFWFENGILKDLPYDRTYALKNNLNEGKELDLPPYPGVAVIHMTGGTTSIEEMIASTRTGFLVTRFHGVLPVEFKSLMEGGNTRDGLWYIENGKIKHPAKNFRFNDSPLFILNEVEELGPVERLYSPPGPVAIPTVKVRNFNFSSLVDAV